MTKQEGPLKVRPEDGVFVGRSGDCFLYSFAAPISISFVTDDDKYYEIPRRFRRRSKLCKIKVLYMKHGVFEIRLVKPSKVWGYDKWDDGTPVIHPHTNDSESGQLCIGTFKNSKFKTARALKNATIRLLSTITLNNNAQHYSEVEKSFRAALKWVQDKEENETNFRTKSHTVWSKNGKHLQSTAST